MSNARRARTRAHAKGHASRVPILWLVLGVIAVLGVVAVVLAAGSDGPDETGEFGVVSVSGSPLPKYDAAAATDPAVGTKVPTVTSNDFGGDTTAIEADGTPKLIAFLAHWCPHCNAEAPRLKAAIEAGIPEGIDVVIVPTGSTATQVNWPPSEWVKDMGISDLTTVVDDRGQSIASAYGLAGYPYLILVDGDGTVLRRTSGEQPEGFFPQAFAELAASKQG